MFPNFMDEEELGRLLKELDPHHNVKGNGSNNNDRPYRMPRDGQKVILAIDDMPAILNSVKSILKNYYKVVGVTSTSMASEFLSFQEADLILLDIEMPEQNGFSFAKSLKMNERTRWIPIVFLTGTGTRASVKEAFQSGGIDYIVKPIKEQVLIDKLAKILG